MTGATLPTSPAEILHRLEQYQPREALSVMGATGYLMQRLPSYQLLALQTLFPNREVSASSLYERPSPEGHSERELACLEALGNLIPLDHWILERAAEDILPGLPLWDAGIDLSEEDVIENLPVGVQICLPLSHDGRYYLEQFDGQGWYESTFGVSLEAIALPYVKATQLRQRFNQQPLPLRFVPLLINVLDKTTNNLWLDCTNNEEWFGTNCDTIVPWKLSEIQQLIRQWRRAENLLNQVKAFTSWLEGDLRPRFNQVLTFWNQPYD